MATSKHGVPRSEEKECDPQEEKSLLSPVANPATANSASEATSDAPLLVKSEDLHNRIDDRRQGNHSKRGRINKLLIQSSHQSSDENLKAQESQQRDVTLTPRNSIGGTTSFSTLVRGCLCTSRLGTLRPPTSETQLPELSVDTRNRVRALDTVSCTSHLEFYVRQTDDLPTQGGSRSSQPQVFIHVLDVCTGHRLYPTVHTSTARASAGSISAFKWNEAHRIPMPLVDFVSPRVLVLIELVQFRRPTAPKTSRHLPDGRRFNRLQQSVPEMCITDDPGRDRTKFKRVAWCFVRPISDQGNLVLKSLLLPTGECNSTLRLQLFHYQFLTWFDIHQAEAQWHEENVSSDRRIPLVFYQYQKRRRIALSASLHLDILPVVSTSTNMTPDHSEKSLVAEHDNQDLTPNVDEKLMPPEKSDDQLTAPPRALDPLLRCQRHTTEPCLVPHRVLHRLPTGRQGCSTLAFSSDGLFLAAAVHQIPSSSTEGWVLHIHEVNTGALWQQCHGHQGMIHALYWALSSASLISAAADGTVRLWRVRSSICAVVGPEWTWQHTPSPTFVYTALFHPKQSEYVVSGASDGIIRFWQIDSRRHGSESRGACTTTTTRLQWRASEGAIHCIRIEPKSSRVLCGDSRGAITVWGPTSSPMVGHLPDYELLRTIQTGQQSIASMHLHPRKQHLLVLTHPHSLLQYELRSYLLLHKGYSGIECEQWLVKASFSPDGRFVTSGSEEGTPQLFTSLHGDRLQRGVWGHRFYHGSPIMDIAWSPTAHIVALCAYGGHHPVVLLCAHRDDAQEDLDEIIEPTTVPLPPSIPTEPRKQDRNTRKAEKEPNSPSLPETPYVNTSDRVQRALERRKQRLQAQVARELNA